MQLVFVATITFLLQNVALEDLMIFKYDMLMN